MATEIAAYDTRHPALIAPWWHTALLAALFIVLAIGGARKFLPRGVLEASLWVGLSASAGFAEELVFRGYLQRQLAALTRSPWAAWALQSALFGISHGYQGAVACAKIAIYGALFGALAIWRRSLRPGMLAHAATDILAGLFRA